MNLDTAWGIRAPTAARAGTINLIEQRGFTDTRFKAKPLRGPEPVTRGTPMPMTMPQICLFLLGV